jgi:vacuolar-type H+-ATPase subunit H
MSANDNGPSSGRFPLSTLRFDDHERVAAWLKSLREQIDDGLAAGEDATRRIRRRVLSRAEARRKLRAATAGIDELMEMAERALGQT